MRSRDGCLSPAGRYARIVRELPAAHRPAPTLVGHHGLMHEREEDAAKIDVAAAKINASAAELAVVDGRSRSADAVEMIGRFTRGDLSDADQARRASLLREKEIAAEMAAGIQAIREAKRPVARVGGGTASAGDHRSHVDASFACHQASVAAALRARLPARCSRRRSTGTRPGSGSARAAAGGLSLVRSMRERF